MDHRSSRLRFGAISLLWFSLISLILFGDTFFDSSWVISTPGMDLENFFYPLRAFAFGQLRSGHFPLWNPYILGGIPAFGNSMYGLLYPPNWIQLFLPANFAINLLIAVHLMLTGLFTCAWCRLQGRSVAASLLGGTVFMLCGPNILRIDGGYLTHAFILPWTPLLFICIDQVFDSEQKSRAILWGSLVVAMQVLAGYIQPTYFEFLAAFCYIVIRLINRRRPLILTAALASIFLLGGALCGLQFLVGYEAAAESVRGRASLFSFATSFSIAPENILTLVCPFPFGDCVSAPIFVRWGWIETSLFIGGVATCLAIIGSVRARSAHEWAMIATALVMLSLSMAEYNPLYYYLLRIVPGLDLFRCPARFAFMTTFFASPLAGKGFDYLIQTGRVTILSIASAIFGMTAGVVAYLIEYSPTFWKQILNALVLTGETWEKLEDNARTVRIIDQSAHFAFQQFIDVGGIFLLIALIALLARSRRAAIYLLLPLALLEMLSGSGVAQARFRPNFKLPHPWAQALAGHSSEERALVLTSTNHNLPMLFGIESIGGYDPAVRSRWDDAVRPLLGAEALTGNLNTRRVLPSQRWSLFRLGVLLPPNENIHLDPPMDRLTLISDYQVVPNRDESMLAIRKPEFDPRKKVILESPPKANVPSSVSDSSAGKVELVHLSIDSMEISAKLDRPAILLVSDAYSTGWRVRPLAPSPQGEYEVLPADHAVRGIPLLAGEHHFVLEYRPRSLYIGAIVSVVGWIVWIVLWGLLWRRSRRTIAAPAN